MSSETSSAIRKQNKLLKKRANLSRETVAATISPNNRTVIPRADHPAYALHPDASKEVHANRYPLLSPSCYVPTVPEPFSDGHLTLIGWSPSYAGDHESASQA